jgi:predicted nucleic acid-binding protein
MDTLLDASAIMAIILNEPNRYIVINAAKNAVLLSSEVIFFEIGNALISLYKRHKLSADEVLAAYKAFISIPLRIMKVDVEQALRIACRYNIYAYDAYYLEVAYRLKLPLITFDTSMKNVGLYLNINIIGGEPKNEDI